MNQQELKLPTGWTNFQYEKFLKLEYGKGLTKKQRNEDGKIPVYGSSGITGHHDKYLIKDSAIIIGRKGDSGKVYFSNEPAWPIDTTYFITNYPMYEQKFLYYLLQYMGLDQLDSSTAIPSLRRDDVYDLEMILPPLNEQKRIIEKINELFLKSNNIKKTLEIVLEQLTEFRQSFLKSVFGIELIDFMPKNIIFSKIFDVKHGKFLPKNKMKKGEFPVYGGNGVIEYHDKYNVEGETIIIGRVGAQCGNVNYFSGKAWITDNSIGIIPKIKINPVFFMYQLKNQYLNESSGGSGQPYITGSKLKESTIITTDIENQNKIVLKIERSFSKIKNYEDSIHEIMSKLPQLNLAILKQAFKGELVPQNPNDEHAELFLKKIAKNDPIIKSKQKKRKNVKE
jgi:type I restriction enzyme, S subunit